MNHGELTSSWVEKRVVGTFAANTIYQRLSLAINLTDLSLTNADYCQIELVRDGTDASDEVDEVIMKSATATFSLGTV